MGQGSGEGKSNTLLNKFLLGSLSDTLTMDEIDAQIAARPLTKEEARQQFIEQTAKLGLKHTFSFDEAWDFVEYKRSQSEYEEKVAEFEQAVNNHSASLGHNSLHGQNPTKHSFADGQYIREIYNPSGLIIVTKIHNRNHPFFLLQGDMTIITDEGQQRIQAPYYGITKAGTKRIIYTHEECVFVTVHATESMDLAEIEEEVIADGFGSTDRHSIDTEQIDKLISKLRINT